MANIPTSIFRLASSRKSKIAYRLQLEQGGYRAITWQDYQEQVLRLAAFMQTRGVGRGDRVVLVAENSPEWSILALAVMNLGAILVPVAAIASTAEIAATIINAKAVFCWLSSRCAGVKEMEMESLPPHEFFDSQSHSPLHSYSEPHAPMALDPLQLGAEDIALMIFTSGTTGQPKAVPLTHGNILTNAQDVLEMISLDESDSIVSVLPLSHMFEFTCGYLVPALSGAQITYTKSLKPEDLLQALKDSRATIMIGVPLLFEIIARNLDQKLQALPGPIRTFFASAEKWVLQYPSLGRWLFYPVHKALGGNIRFFASGGARLQPETYNRFASLGITILQGYGLTETSPVLCGTRLGASGPDHVGLPMRQVEVGIFNDAGEKLSQGQEGEIWARGPSVFRGYGEESQNKGVFFNDWFRTGDLGTLDSQGFLRITGRKKDIIVTAAGKNVYPEEIESSLIKTGKFIEVCALGMSDSAGHENVCVVVYPDPAKFARMSREQLHLNVEDSVRLVCNGLSEYKRPSHIYVVEHELPKTSTRKIKKHEVKKLLLVGGANANPTADSGAGSLDLENSLESALANAIAPIAHLDPEKMRLSQHLSRDLRLDSLTLVEVLSVIENQFGQKLGEFETAELQTLEDLLLYLRRNLGTGKKRAKVFFSDFSPKQNRWLIFSFPRFLLIACLKLILRLFWNLRVEGLEHLPVRGALLFAPNHTSHFDTLAIQAALPFKRMQRNHPVAAKDYFFNTAWKSLFARILINAIPFDRKGRVDESMARCREALAERASLTIFPEGTRSPDGKLQLFKPGVGQLAAGRIDVLTVPVWIEGAFAAMPKGASFPRRSKLKIRFGKPISYAGYDQSHDSQKQLAAHLHQAVKELSCRDTL